MYFFHSKQIWRDYPRLVPLLMAADGIHTDVDEGPRVQHWYQRARDRLSDISESQLPEVTAWRRVYSQMGFKPTKYRSAAEALLRRFRREGLVSRVHPLVDICNAVSLAFALPVAVLDPDHIDEFIEVRYAKGDESYLAFSGEVEHPEPGEVIFVDASKAAHARRWTFRQSLTSVVRPETTRVLIVSEAMHETAAEDMVSLGEALSTEIAGLWTAPKNQSILSAENCRFDFD